MTDDDDLLRTLARHLGSQLKAPHALGVLTDREAFSVEAIGPRPRFEHLGKLVREARAAAGLRPGEIGKRLPEGRATAKFYRSLASVEADNGGLAHHVRAIAGVLGIPREALHAAIRADREAYREWERRALEPIEWVDHLVLRPLAGVSIPQELPWPIPLAAAIRLARDIVEGRVKPSMEVVHVPAYRAAHLRVPRGRREFPVLAPDEGLVYRGALADLLEEDEAAAT